MKKILALLTFLYQSIYRKSFKCKRKNCFLDFHRWYDYTDECNASVIFNEKILKTLQPIHLHTKLRSSFAYVNTVDLLYISIPNLSKPISLYPRSSINFCLSLIFAIHNFVCKQLLSMLLNSYRFQQHYGFS